MTLAEAPGIVYVWPSQIESSGPAETTGLSTRVNSIESVVSWQPDNPCPVICNITLPKA